VRLYKVIYPQDFHALMEELESGEDLDYKVAFLTFVNTMIVQGQSIKDRVKVREDFMLERITDILAVRAPSYVSMLLWRLCALMHQSSFRFTTPGAEIAPRR
jgi:hypothetical protein